MEQTESKKQIPHYYGDLVRIIFIIGAVFVLLGIPFVTDILNIPAIIPIFAIAILAVTAGITNPAQLFSLKLNMGVSVAFLVFFAYMGWYAYDAGLGGGIGLSNQVGAVLFLVASYFSVKSLRGAIVPERQG